jgi:NarL family two-component system response regulator LiaR
VGKYPIEPALSGRLLDATKNIRMLLVDDHPVIRYGIRHMLDAEDDIEVVGELDSLQGIGAALIELRPDVVLLDLELEKTHGVDALRFIREEAPGLHVIIYTSHDEDERIIQAAELGVDGYLLKGSPKDEIVGAIRNVHDGGTSLDSAVAAKLMQHMNKRSGKRKEPAIGFSKREAQVLDLLAAGKTNRKIGTTLFISESTVKFHVHAILSKLDAGNRTEAVSIASQLGIISMVASD